MEAQELKAFYSPGEPAVNRYIAGGGLAPHVDRAPRENSLHIYSREALKRSLPFFHTYLDIYIYIIVYLITLLYLYNIFIFYIYNIYIIYIYIIIFIDVYVMYLD